MENTSSVPGISGAMQPPASSARYYRWIIPLILLVLAGGAVAMLISSQVRHAPENAPMPVSAAIEDRYGIRISQVAVTADGGMVDLRYVLVDPNKAANFGEDAQSTPVLVPEGGKVVVSETALMPHKETLHPGVTYFLLYHNAAGSIKTQTYVTIELGDLRLEHVPVR
jgi:hypothetical protein